MTALAIASGTDYAIFLIGRYHEARQNGEDPESAYYTAFHGVGHVILGSGLTIAGATLTLRLTRLSYFNSLAYPSGDGPDHRRRRRLDRRSGHPGRAAASGCSTPSG